MTQVQVTQAELEALLHEQLEFLKLSCGSFDDGFEGEIKRLAVAVRVLVHDTQASTSLLSLTGKKARKFLDSSDPYDDESLISHSSLVQVHLTPQGGKPKAHLDDIIEPRWIEFEDWWNGVVLVDAKKNEFSRKDIVLHLANKEGGAHVDHRIDERYHGLRKGNALGWVNVLGDGRRVVGDDQVPSTMRQIAHELVKTLDSSYACTLRSPNGTSMIVRGMSVVEGAQPQEGPSSNLRKDRPIVGGRKVGRNDLCPCGSGKKFKKCCI